MLLLTSVIILQFERLQCNPTPDPRGAKAGPFSLSVRALLTVAESSQRVCEQGRLHGQRVRLRGPGDRFPQEVGAAREPECNCPHPPPEPFPPDLPPPRWVSPSPRPQNLVRCTEQARHAEFAAIIPWQGERTEAEECGSSQRGQIISEQSHAHSSPAYSVCGPSCTCGPGTAAASQGIESG